MAKFYGNDVSKVETYPHRPSQDLRSETQISARWVPKTSRCVAKVESSLAVMSLETSVADARFMSLNELWWISLVLVSLGEFDLHHSELNDIIRLKLITIYVPHHRSYI